MAVAAWVERLGAEIGAGAAPLEAGGAVEIRFEPGLDVAFEAGSDRDAAVHLLAILGPAPAEDEDEGERLEELLARNHVTSGPDAAALALDPVRGEILLCRRVDAAEAGSYEGFVRLVEAFIERALRLHEELGDGAAGGPAPEKPASDDPLFLFANFIRG
jgi:hypothetical protein